MSKAFKALSDKTRREILKMLNEKDMNAGREIAEHFNMSKPSISKHLDIFQKRRTFSEFVEKKGQL